MKSMKHLLLLFPIQLNAGFAENETTISETGEITNDDPVPSISFDSTIAKNIEGMAISFPVSFECGIWSRY